MKPDVVIVGGGPAGAATAIGLARAGMGVRLLDRAAFPRAKPCGEFLSPAATPLLEALGVRREIEAAGALRLGEVRIRNRDGATLSLDFDASEGVPAWGYAISRTRFDAILLDAARSSGADVIERVIVDRIHREGDRVAGVVARRDGRSEDGPGRRIIRARLVVGAGGRNCPIARALDLQRRAAKRRVDLLAHWRGGEGPGLRCELHIGDDGYVGAAPIEGGRVNVNGVVPQAALRADPDPERVYRRLLAARPEITRWTRRATPSPVVATDVTPLTTDRATADGALLVGDSALFLDPFTGQGIYLALESARLATDVIVDALARGRVDADALARYDRLRAERFRAKRRVSEAIQRILRHPPLARRTLRALDRAPDLAATVAGVTGDALPAERALGVEFGLRFARAALPI